ncbi:MAG: cation:proton antiporter [Candidatus Woesearchaeota archaeon]|nr:MAG: cation:proton antiporter [Candidatus Woesearchaeota archaeon]
MELILFLAGVFLITFFVGRLLEKIRIPWIFSALLIGLGLAAFNPFKEITSSSSFVLLAELGMYFLLFIIGFELEITKIMKSGKFIVKTTIAIIVVEAVVGAALVHYLFDVPWLISLLVSSSFATVGEAVLLPILEEFNLVKTKLGQTILGIGVLDDVVEVITIILFSIIIGRTAGHTHFNIWLNLLILFMLFGLAFVVVKFRKQITSFKYKEISSFFLFVLFFIFLFVGIGKIVESAALGALLAGISLRNIIPEKVLAVIDSEIKTMAYGFFAPIFFLSVGVDTDISYIIKFPLLILLVMLMTNVTKIATSYFVGKKELGKKHSILLGISLCVKFSTSIVIIKLLFEKGLIEAGLYSVLVGTTIAFKFVVPFLLSYLINKWNIRLPKPAPN